jgi:hypothetical protein
VDRLDRLSQQFIEKIDSARDTRRPDCPPMSQFEAYYRGDINPEVKQKLESHFESCLNCLGDYVELRDLLSGAEDPAPLNTQVKERLRGILNNEINKGNSPSFLSRITSFLSRFKEYVQGLFDRQISVRWSLGGALAAASLAAIAVNLAVPTNDKSKFPQGIERMSLDSPHELSSKDIERMYSKDLIQGKIFIEVLSTKNMAHAKKIHKQLVDLGISASIEKIVNEEQKSDFAYRVIMGPFPNDRNSIYQRK